MPDSPTAETESAFVCDSGEEMRSACVGEPFYKEHEGKRYCVLHFPSQEKSADFQKAVQRKLDNKDFNFQGVWFSDELSFFRFDFTGIANFDSATFNAEVDFSSAVLRAGANFSSTIFNVEPDFTGTTFGAETPFSFAMFNAGANFIQAAFTSKADFTSATFSGDAYFSQAKFGGTAKFSFATFSGGANFNANFSAEADFDQAVFSGEANFGDAVFESNATFMWAKIGAEACFSGAVFSAWAGFGNAIFGAEVDFSNASFVGNADFFNGTFKEDADFRRASFKAKANFARATFSGYLKFAGEKEEPLFGDKSSLDLDSARIEKPEHVSFHTVTMHPHWFVNVDAREFDFSNVHWKNDGKAKPEIELLKEDDMASPHRLLAIACRKLAANSEENDRYREASHFRRMAMDAERLETWRGFGFLRLSWWYWLASGYGERPFQAFLVLIGLLLISAVLYTQVGFVRWEPKLASESDVVIAKRDDVGAPLKFNRALTYSVGVMTLQKPEPRPATTAAQTAVILGTILGPVQAALLALAI